ncbi:uncharacterized protein BP5553_02979 [Venustampulla echinocandica]|uniref:Large ribosomal subunit protein mL54 n=1 Tax=Venustampulla echinocandica TaxID=2656787 RepID=A0A370TSY1_9HELO|nr:uncharacterized protein BP5553_02979 [Venustampulla echinocandica]RDL38639.1 hypothetical protein BP5553_02979 [Venustampulla echinocandica]
MICRSCLRWASALRPTIPLSRSFATTSAFLEPATSTPGSPRTAGPPTATSTGLAQPFSTPLSPTPNSVSLGTLLRPKPTTTPAVISSCVPGTPLKGINYLKGRDDPLAKPDEEYPEWLWRCLDAKKPTGEEEEDANAGDMFSKSKKLRRKAAKRQRKLEAELLASGNLDALAPKIPITQQSIDLPANEEGTTEGAMEAVNTREDIRKAMRRERRKAIKEKNYLKTM